MEESSHPIVLFDGVCNFCESSVQFILKRDPQGVFRFASLQSPPAQALLKKFNQKTDDFSTMLLVEGEKFYTQSTAALKIARRLRFPWPLLYIFIVIPKPLRNFIYNWIARNRYRWFGKKEECMIPTPDMRARFLSEKGSGA